ncbi:DUF4181 domain-containing protein [Metabacillus litoralis]|uniref:DUF4181 domain-containing protein n=1 Tax=Metabacillus litoralis TaxID=152268 RepID=UPI001E2AFDCC|nr:DUF4181 domain-containing protein [Metabacillus litoralis]UHA58789.1 DUF4181 domain-containing protein [Metabacillus litoralis]
MAIKFTMIIFIIFLNMAMIEMIEGKLKIPKNWYLAKPVNNIHKWLSRILLFVLIVFVIVSQQLNFDISVYSVFLVLLFSEILRAIMEWIYEKQTKRYILSIYNSMIWVIILLVWFL